MSSTGYTIEVTGLSPAATEKDVRDFFSFCGAIDHVEIIRSGEHACTAYVTFRNSHAQETAVLLSGATLLDQSVCITPWGQSGDDFNFWNRHPQGPEDERSSNPQERGQSIPIAGEAVTRTQEVVKTMLSRGYVLGKDALGKAKAFDESHQISSSAKARVSELSQRIGLADKISAGFEAAKSVDEKYRFSESAKSAVSATGRTASAAASSVVNSSYFSKGALWVSGALNRVSQAAADLGNRNSSH